MGSDRPVTHGPTPPLARLLPLVFLSGACALVYQIAWTREFRLIFGASTPASAAVVAIFVGGLGLGAWKIGARVERHPQPVRLYAWMELGIALSSALTLPLVSLASHAYAWLGGTVVLGMTGATIVRLLFAALVLAVPTVLMGGTLPVLARATTSGRGGDPGRRRVGLLYGVNTLGAVAGCFLANFFLLERLGTARAVLLAVLVNAALAALARVVARRWPEPDGAPEDAPADDEAARRPPVRPALVYAASAIAGFAFFLMEMVFTRMLVPLLGGTVYTFGLVLAVALLGIGVGGALYAAIFSRSSRAGRPPGISAFAVTCLVEALGLAVPYALGDRLAVLAILLRPLGDLGLAGYASGWLVVATLVVFPASVASGVQFPLLVALLGRGGRDVGRHVGLAYAWNTTGAIAGALGGGFGLMPLLTAVGCWRDAVWLLAGTGALASGVALAREPRFARILGHCLLLATVFAVMLVSTGPTAAWRHSPIGAGRVSYAAVATPEDTERWLRDQRRSVAWDADGIESTVALVDSGGYAFLTNGKSDGGCRDDAGTQVMGGLLGALLHPDPRSAMVIGLGSGSSAGWLASVPGIERVDVVELEPSMLEVARRCAPVNHHALDNPRLHVVRGDAREVLSVTRDRYDVVFSEPSNPYRAGVASLYTREYYRRARDHLRDGGLFLQWVQAYEIEAPTLRTIFATMAAEFPFVEVWQLEPPDLLLVGSASRVEKSAGPLRARVAAEPFAEALRDAWEVQDLEGVLAHYVAGPHAVQRLAAEGRDPLNTDDQPVVEFGFARSVGEDRNGNDVTVEQVRSWADSTNDGLPEVAGDVDLQRILLARAEIPCIEGRPPHAVAALQGADADRVEFERLYQEGKLKEALAKWGDLAPSTLIETHDVALAAVHEKDPHAAAWLEALARTSPLDAQVLQAELLIADKRHAEAADALERALGGYRADPWPSPEIMGKGVTDAVYVAIGDRSLAPRMQALLSEPFALELQRDQRLKSALMIAQLRKDWAGCRDALAPQEPWTPWSESELEFRRDCYQANGDPRTRLAEAELARFRGQQAPKLANP